MFEVFVMLVGVVMLVLVLVLVVRVVVVFALVAVVRGRVVDAEILERSWKDSGSTVTVRFARCGS